jgi:tRNA-dihydrouridine synthase B
MSRPDVQHRPLADSPRGVLAPMAGVTDRPFRILARRLGAALAASEMITSDTAPVEHAKSRRRMDHEGEPEPRVVQLAGADPRRSPRPRAATSHSARRSSTSTWAARRRRSATGLCGSALLTDECWSDRFSKRWSRRHGASRVPVTLKTRTGWDREHRNAVRIARIAEASGIAALAIHGRTRGLLYRATPSTTRSAISNRVSNSSDGERRYRHAEKGPRRT